MAGMIPDTKLQGHDGSNSAAGPELPPEAIGFGALVQERGQASELCGRHPPGRPRGWAMTEGIWSPLASTCQPLADGPCADAQRCGDLALPPALLREVPGLETSGFFPVGGCAVHAWECSATPLV
ncbi:MAG: hypothetical protein M3361_14580 [Candidatus Tectomicrobia bacterium]|nr:hypothetical protein [Candidatus Tectomicrobia bacterium]